MSTPMYISLDKVLILIISWVVLAFIAGGIAKRKNFGYFKYFFLSLFLSPLIALITIACKRSERVFPPELTEEPPEFHRGYHNGKDTKKSELDSLRLKKVISEEDYLARLRHENLISEEEYQRRLRQILSINDTTAKANDNKSSLAYRLFCCKCEEFNSYIGFYPDRKVIQINSTGSSQKVIRWFNWDCDHAGKGHYDIADDEISFTVTYSRGSSDYIGSLKHEKLEMWINAFWDSEIDEYIGKHKVFEYVGELRTDGSLVEDCKLSNIKGLLHS